MPDEMPGLKRAREEQLHRPVDLARLFAEQVNAHLQNRENRYIMFVDGKLQMQLHYSDGSPPVGFSTWLPWLNRPGDAPPALQLLEPFFVAGTWGSVWLYVDVMFEKVNGDRTKMFQVHVGLNPGKMLDPTKFIRHPNGRSIEPVVADLADLLLPKDEQVLLFDIDMSVAHDECANSVEIPPGATVICSPSQ